MRAITTDLHTRLTAALSCPVLLPEQRELPLQGRKPGQAGGLSGYLQQHPGGYVQLYDPQPVMTTSGIYDEHWATVDAIAATDGVADLLAQQVRSLIGGTPRTGGRIRLAIPPRTERDGVSVRVTLQFSVRSAHPR